MNHSSSMFSPKLVFPYRQAGPSTAKSNVLGKADNSTQTTMWEKDQFRIHFFIIIKLQTSLGYEYSIIQYVDHFSES